MRPFFLLGYGPFVLMGLCSKSIMQVVYRDIRVRLPPFSLIFIYWSCLKDQYVRFFHVIDILQTLLSNFNIVCGRIGQLKPHPRLNQEQIFKSVSIKIFTSQYGLI
jgi:hypothetical protein